VFSLLVDCGNLAALDRKTKFFSNNRFNLISLYDRDFGDGKSLPHYLSHIARSSGHDATIDRFVMLCYPRILGYAFNPITVYFGLDAEGKTRLTIYEVNNTFGERKSYVLPAEQDADGFVWQQCPKQFFVSPFNKVSGTYNFHLSPISKTMTLGVTLKDHRKPVLRAHFHGQRRDLTDKGLIGAVARTGMMTLKVIVGIHYQALKLWVKGLRLQAKPPAPTHPITYFKGPRNGVEHQPLVENGDRNIEGGRKTNPQGVGHEQPARAPVNLSRRNDEHHDQHKDGHNNNRRRPKLAPAEKQRRPEPVQ
jgi:hypothetical protein